MATYPHPLLTDDDLADLTGLSQPAAQRRWLDRHGIAYTVRVDGAPRTTWGAVEAALDKCPKIAQHFPMLGVLRLGRASLSSAADWSHPNPAPAPAGAKKARAGRAQGRGGKLASYSVRPHVGQQPDSTAADSRLIDRYTALGRMPTTCAAEFGVEPATSASLAA